MGSPTVKIPKPWVTLRAANFLLVIYIHSSWLQCSFPLTSSSASASASSSSSGHIESAPGLKPTERHSAMWGLDPRDVAKLIPGPRFSIYLPPPLAPLLPFEGRFNELIRETEAAMNFRATTQGEGENGATLSWYASKIFFLKSQVNSQIVFNFWHFWMITQGLGSNWLLPSCYGSNWPIECFYFPCTKLLLTYNAVVPKLGLVGRIRAASTFCPAPWTMLSEPPPTKKITKSRPHPCQIKHNKGEKIK